MNDQRWQQATAIAHLESALWRLWALANRAGDAAFPLGGLGPAQGEHAGRWHHTVVIDRGEAPGLTSPAMMSPLRGNSAELLIAAHNGG